MLMASNPRWQRGAGGGHPFILTFQVITLVRYTACTSVTGLYTVVENININNINISKCAIKYVRKEYCFSTVSGREVMKWWLHKKITGLPWCVQWLRLHAPNAGDLVLIPDGGTRSHIPQVRVHVPQLKICMRQLRLSTAKKKKNTLKT